jgi:predicted permease
MSAGRAGRRGYDDFGNVVFFGMRPERAAQLITTKLPSLQGQFPTSTAMALRMLVLQQQMTQNYAALMPAQRERERDPTVALQSSLRLLLSNPMLVAQLKGSELTHAQALLAHHFRVSLQVHSFKLYHNHHHDQ